jgi:prolyl-tRNA editing enzyme YbaK/EbsC (Cys-tRNA(Pro) deacylase)/CBS domain-containing protein
VAKTVVIEADGDVWMAVVPAPEIVDLQRLGAVLGVQSVRLMTEREFAPLFAGSEVGAEPPLGKLYRIPVVLDEDLAQEPEIIFRAGTHDETIRMRFRDYSQLESPLIADFSELPRWNGPNQSRVPVSELMTRAVAVCRTADPLSVPAQLMWDRDCGAIPVLEPEGDRVVGMITDRDICMATLIQDRRPSNIAVNEAMSRELFTCLDTDLVAHAEDILRAHQIRRLPVLDVHGRLAGILSLADIARRADALARARADAPAIPADEISNTLGEICQPRALHAGDFAHA